MKHLTENPNTPMWRWAFAIQHTPFFNTKNRQFLRRHYTARQGELVVHIDDGRPKGEDAFVERPAFAYEQYTGADGVSRDVWRVRLFGRYKQEVFNGVFCPTRFEWLEWQYFQYYKSALERGIRGISDGHHPSYWCPDARYMVNRGQALRVRLHSDGTGMYQPLSHPSVLIGYRPTLGQTDRGLETVLQYHFIRRPTAGHVDLERTTKYERGLGVPDDAVYQFQAGAVWGNGRDWRQDVDFDARMDGAWFNWLDDPEQVAHAVTVEGGGAHPVVFKAVADPSCLPWSGTLTTAKRNNIGARGRALTPWEEMCYLETVTPDAVQRNACAAQTTRDALAELIRTQFAVLRKGHGALEVNNALARLPESDIGAVVMPYLDTTQPMLLLKGLADAVEKELKFRASGGVHVARHIAIERALRPVTEAFAGLTITIQQEWDRFKMQEKMERRKEREERQSRANRQFLMDVVERNNTARLRLEIERDERRRERAEAAAAKKARCAANRTARLEREAADLAARQRKTP